MVRTGIAITRRRGVSLIEVLIVVGVIGILLGILIPAVLNARAAARAVQCKDNLHQLCVASESFQTANGHWPVRFMDLLPQLDRRPAQDMLLEWEQAGQSTGAFPPIPAVPNVAMLSCPADSRMPGQHRARVSYFMNDGTTVLPLKSKRKSNGIVGDRGPHLEAGVRRPSEVTDGLSNTALFAERLVWRGLISTAPSSSPPNPLFRYTWRLSSTPADAAGVASSYAATTNWVWPPTGHHSRAAGAARLYAFETWYDHALVPNSRPVYTASQEFDEFRASRPATSEHHGGVHVALCDGSVRFVSETVDPDVWSAVGTRSGKEVFENDEF